MKRKQRNSNGKAIRWTDTKSGFRHAEKVRIYKKKLSLEMLKNSIMLNEIGL